MGVTAARSTTSALGLGVGHHEIDEVGVHHLVDATVHPVAGVLVSGDDDEVLAWAAAAEGRSAVAE